MASGTVESDRPAADPLRADSKNTLKHALQYYLEYERDFSVMYFPEMVQRGYVSWSDVERLTSRQAGALAPLLADSIRYFTRQDERERAKHPPAAERDPDDPDAETEFGRKAEIWSEALRDMCAAFGLPYPS
jgi:hypothetical protein